MKHDNVIMTQLKQGLAKVQAKNEAWKSHFMLPRM
jgi:hypothetical protein